MSKNMTKAEMYERIQAEYPGYHPVVAMVRLAHTTRNESMRFACHSEIAKYVEPKLASIAHTHKIEAGTGVLLVEAPKSGEDWAAAAQLASKSAFDQALLIEGEAALEE